MKVIKVFTVILAMAAAVSCAPKKTTEEIPVASFLILPASVIELKILIPQKTGRRIFLFSKTGYL